MEFLAILQDFVPYRGRCPAIPWDFMTLKKQGKGTADLMMPFGVLFSYKQLLYKHAQAQYFEHILVN